MGASHAIASKIRTLTFAAVLLALMTFVVACSSDNKSSSTPTASGAAANGTPAATSASGGQGGGNSSSSGSSAGSLPDVASVVNKVKPAVVQITSEQTQVNQFNQPFNVPAGVGSGVIYDSQGHILTNAHVVEGASKLTVALTDGRTMQATLVGSDTRSDIAVIKIDGSNLPVAELGTNTGYQVGDWVVAIGNALGLPGGPTVTVGVVSAIGRTVQEPGSSNGSGGSSSGGAASTSGPFLFDLIQTDAAINPGNSGGALVDMNAHVIGINTLVAGEAEPGVPTQGIGFAINIKTASTIAQQLVTNGSVSYPYIGIAYVPLTPAIASRLGTNVQNGAVVTDVAAGSPAAQAGIRPNDIITKIDGQDLVDQSTLAATLANKKPGDKVTLTVNRNGATQDITVTLGTAPP
ncbi:MAG TPA: trypsin-like peptidase domain-containing protein [Dehalococcoidia bacterium]|jgi:S1-C subfamily serine protease